MKKIQKNKTFSCWNIFQNSASQGFHIKIKHLFTLASKEHIRKKKEKKLVYLAWLGNFLIHELHNAGTNSKEGTSECPNVHLNFFLNLWKEFCDNSNLGYYYVGDQTICLPCPEGYYTDLKGTTACGACPAGTYSYMGSASCNKCPPGTYSKEKSSYCYEDY